MIETQQAVLERHVLWQSQEAPGMEHLYLQETDESIIAHGSVISVADGQPLHMHYRIQCSSSYRFQTLQLELTEPYQRLFHLSLTDDGHWHDNAGRYFAHLDGCVDIDLSASPFTNTLPIRRLDLHERVPTAIQVVYIDLPELTLSVERQRYTLFQVGTYDSLYRFEHLANGFTADIRVDSDGLVRDYPKLFRRVWAR